MTHYAETQFGFDWGAAKLSRCLSDDRYGVVITIATTGNQVVNIRVTPGGRIRVGSIGRRRIKRIPGTARGSFVVDEGAPIP